MQLTLHTLHHTLQHTHCNTRAATTSQDHTTQSRHICMSHVTQKKNTCERGWVGEGRHDVGERALLHDAHEQRTRTWLRS